MLTHGLPATYAFFIWWLSTGLVLYAVGRPRAKHRKYMAVISVLAALALIALSVTSHDASVSAAFCAFTSAIVVWAWHEMSFLTGSLTGPRVTPCPGRSREPANKPAPLLPAIQSVIYHEVGIVLTAAITYGLVQDGPNMTGLWTFLILWIMRLSAKLNVYLGVPNLTEQFLPQHLLYLKSYFCRKPMNGLFPISVTASTVIAALLVIKAAAAITPFEAASLTFLATLMSLAVLEHWFLVIPLPAANLWSWGLKSRRVDTTVERPPADLAAMAPALEPT